jgi:hypothetical protein
MRTDEDVLKETVERSKDFPLYYVGSRRDYQSLPWSIMKHAKRGGDREIARCWSYEQAALIARALNIYDTIKRVIRK